MFSSEYRCEDESQAITAKVCPDGTNPNQKPPGLSVSPPKWSSELRSQEAETTLQKRRINPGVKHAAVSVSRQQWTDHT